MNQTNFEEFNNLGHESLDRINELGHTFLGEIINVALPIVNNMTNNNINANIQTRTTIKTETIFNDNHSMVLLAYIPGVNKENAKVNIKNDNKTLIIEGTTSLYSDTTQLVNKHEKIYYREVKTSFDINNSNLDVKYIGGVLKITIVKTQFNNTNVNIN